MADCTDTSEVIDSLCRRFSSSAAAAAAASANQGPGSVPGPPRQCLLTLSTHRRSPSRDTRVTPSGHRAASRRGGEETAG
ncbi:hypothetical protein EYF80_051042 [Liparis tanakae]|uniref:Uncharacterized protein n=1 Tax=Liparis tanakae TaxID=230148 RepID=A0A4Z2FCZ3_9TELE|nr:hypothetical protein EYF80_051042 [Liparis tanakae]